MNSSRHTLAQLLVLSLALAAGGCFESGGPDPDECEATKVCRAPDALGCCAEGGVEVSVCESCPAGTIEETSCRTEGCLACDEPYLCVEDLGEGCCGRQVTRCTPDCPAGMTLVAADYCGAYYPSCGCGPEFTGGEPGARPAPEPEPRPVPPIQDAGMPDGAGHSDAAPSYDAGQPECVEDFGDGCCGRFVAYMTECGCPVGSVRSDFYCGDWAGDRIIAPTETCYADLGGGCCGGVVEANACSGACPSGSLPESSCGARHEGAPMEFDPIPAPACFVQLSEGCCGEPVEADVCGQCPAGATMDCTAFLPECS